MVHSCRQVAFWIAGHKESSRARECNVATNFCLDKELFMMFSNFAFIKQTSHPSILGFYLN
jgi:hypothetical protein